MKNCRLWCACVVLLVVAGCKHGGDDGPKNPGGVEDLPFTLSNFPTKGFMMPGVAGGTYQLGTVFCMKSSTPYLFTRLDVTGATDDNVDIPDYVLSGTKNLSGSTGAVLNLAYLDAKASAQAESSKQLRFTLKLSDAHSKSIPLANVAEELGGLGGQLESFGCDSGYVVTSIIAAKGMTLEFSSNRSQQLASELRAELKNIDIGASSDVKGGSSSGSVVSLVRQFDEPRPVFVQTYGLTMGAGMDGSTSWELTSAPHVSSSLQNLSCEGDTKAKCSQE